MEADHKVETPATDGVPSAAATQSHKDNSTVEPPQHTNSSSTPKPNKKKRQSKNKKKSAPPPKSSYLDIIQQEIDDLKKEARHTYEIQARQNFEGELVDDERTILEKRMTTSTVIDKLEELKTKLETPDTVQKVSNDGERIPVRKSGNDRAKETIGFEDETLTLLHFFYIVRLAQKGFFTLISQNYPKVEPGALVYLCDKLVGGSLFVVKDPNERVQSAKRKQVFELLRKLHSGATESIGNGFVTTFEQVRHLIYDFIESTATHDDKTSLESLQDNSNSSSSSIQRPPVWIVVPFNGMVDGLQQQDGSSILSSSQQQKKLTNDISKKNKQQSSAKTTMDESANVTSASIPSATHDIESTSQPNGSITPNIEEDEQHKHLETAATTNDTLDNQANQGSKAPLDDTSNVKSDADTVNPPITTNTDTASVKESESTPTANTATTEPTSTSISSSVDTDDVAISTTTIDTTTITNNSSSTTTKDSTIEPQQQKQQEEEQQKDASSGWGTPPSLTTASSAWAQGILLEENQQQQVLTEAKSEITTATENDGEDDNDDSGWGTPMASNSPPAWEGKLPEDMTTPGDETISSDLTESQWQPVSDYGQRRTMGGRGRPSSYRGGSGFGQGRGGGGYRSYGDGRGGSSSGMRRGPGASANAGWSKARSLRSE